MFLANPQNVGRACRLLLCGSGVMPAECLLVATREDCPAIWKYHEMVILFPATMSTSERRALVLSIHDQIGQR